MAKKTKRSRKGTEAQASEPAASEPGKDEQEVASTDDVETETPERTRLYRGQKCKILKTSRDRATGTVYDVIEYTRKITNRRDGSQEEVKLGLKLRRTDTGNEVLSKEEEIIE